MKISRLATKKHLKQCLILSLLCWGVFLSAGQSSVSPLSRDVVARQVQAMIRKENSNLPSNLVRSISDTVLTLSRSYDIDPRMILAVIKVESNFRPEVESFAGAIGLMQVKPIVVKEVEGDLPIVNRPARDLLVQPLSNIHIGVHYLDFLRKKFGNDWYRILSAYNMGPTFVRRHRQPPARYYNKVMRAYRGFPPLTATPSEV